MPSTIEYILYAIFNFLPYSFFVYYPLRYFRRFSKGITAFLFLLGTFFHVVLFLSFIHFFPKHVLMVNVLSFLLSFSFYFIAFKASFGRMLFNLLMLTNIANFVSILGKFIESRLAYDMAMQSYRWTYSLSIFVLELLCMFPLFYFTKHFSDTVIRDDTYNFIWRYSWLLPLSLCLIGFFTIYDSSRITRLEMAMKPESVLLYAMIVCSQVIIYGFVAHLVEQHEAILKLKQDVYYQSLQNVQFRNMEEQIKDTRILRHDLRHHITLMCHYVNQEQYTALKTYLNQYFKTMEQIAQLHYTENSALNALLVYYADLCRSSQILFDVHLLLPAELPLTDSEITVLFGNLLENACDACLEQPEGLVRSISVFGVRKQQLLVFTIRNTYHNPLKTDGQGNYLTTKPNGSGIGIHSIKKIIQAHDGYLSIHAQDDSFQVSFTIPS